MLNKNAILISFILLLAISAISAASAADLNQTAETASNDMNYIIAKNGDVELITQTQKTFTDLDNDINSNNNSDIYLNNDYTFNSDSDTNFTEGIIISRQVTIWGNGHVLNGNNAARIFTAEASAAFRDITFINGKTYNNGGAIDANSIALYVSGYRDYPDQFLSINGTPQAVNCTFIGNSAGYGGATSDVDCINCSFINNTAYYNSGAGNAASYVNCTFTGNTAKYYGGAVYIGSTIRKYPITNCIFTENHATVGGAINVMFPDTTPIDNCSFIRNSAAWEAGAIYNGDFNNCYFSENFAEYGGAIKYGIARNSTFRGNYANFGGAGYQSQDFNCSFIENYADYGGATYESFRTINSSFIGNYAFLGGAMYGKGTITPNNCYFAYNSAKSGGAIYQANAKNSFFAYNKAVEYGGAMYGETATNCTFKNNSANISGNDTYNTKIFESSTNVSNSSNIIYFDASAEKDGNGSESNPYKYLYSERIGNGVIAYFKEGTYELNSTCIITTETKLIGHKVKINSKVSDQYDFIIKENSCLELQNLHMNNVNFLNQGTMNAEDCYFEGIFEFNYNNLPEIESSSGLFDSSYGGIILCDGPINAKTTLILSGCYFQRVNDAFNGGAIAAINSDISISDTQFSHYSSKYKGGAIYCVNSKIDMYNGQFSPFTSSDDEDPTTNNNNPYTAYYGGSIYCENSTIYSHRSKFTGSVSYSFGGCIASMNSNITIIECNFTNSQSLTDGGGAIYNSKSELYIYDSKFDSNSAEFGGSICNINSVLDLYHSTYRNNHANLYGGVIYDIYGTLNFYVNQFYVSYAQAGGTIYTRIPNNVNMQRNTFGDSFAKEGASIFYDGKKENVMANSYGNDYTVFAEFRATLDGEEYYLISNPLYYQLTSYNTTTKYYHYSVYEVNDGLVSLMINGNDDEENQTSIITHDAVNRISVSLGFSDRFVNPTLNIYLFGDLNSRLIFRTNGNVYTEPRDEIFKDYFLLENYSIDLSEKIKNNKYNFTEPYTIDFGNSFLSEKYDNLYEAASFNSVSTLNGTFLNPAALPTYAEVLPLHYNSNDYGFVSSVKDQKDGGNCWAFSGIATLETCLSKATGIRYDFSEENAKNLMAAYSVYGIKIETNYAGYESMILSYLTSWMGPIDESVENYDDYSSISTLENPMFHIQNVKFLPARMDSQDNDLYKLAIRDNGAVSVTFRWGDDFHSASLVGWDDNYVGYDSLGKYAKGAWIFKNSWGAEWENNGFGYLSYEHKLSEQIYPNLHAYTFVFNDNNPYTKIYQYDFAGVSEFYHYMDSIYFKNTFTAESDAILSAFSTYFDSETNFTAMVYKNDQLVYSQNGTAPAGYYTVPLNTQIRLDRDDRFSIALHNHNKGYNCIPVCSAEDITKKTFSQNVSFISMDGENWFDLYDYADSCNVACIKAFTQNINLTDIRINIDEFKSINTKNINIKVNLDSADASKINHCLVKFIIDGNTYYAQIKDAAAILNINLDEGQHSLSAQYKDNLFESNIVRFNFTVGYDSSDNSFNALQDIINDAEDKSTVILDRDYFYNEKFDDGEYGVNINKTVTIDGKGHVINGLSEGAGFYISAGNVILNNIIFNDTFSSNGGAIYIAARNVTLNNCSFINSKASQNGGGIYSLFDISINGCEFINNTAKMGGGLYLINTYTTSIRNTLFSNNFAGKHGSAAYAEGIGTFVISSTNFTDNAARYNGGAISSFVYLNNFTDCIFENNTANAGGAIFSNAHVNEFYKTLFSANSAQKTGGAISSHNRISISGCDFNNNTIITAEMSPFGSFGGGAIYSYDDLNVYNSRFTNNSAGYGGALYSSKHMKVYKSQFTNNFASFKGGAIYDSDWMQMAINMGILLFSEARIYDSYFENNSAKEFGAIYTAKLISNCTFINNHAEYAGAVYSAQTVQDSLFIKNHAEYSGAAFYEIHTVKNTVFTGNSAKYGGAGYKADSVQNCTFTNNTADKGGAIDIAENVIGSIFIRNSADNGGAIHTVKNVSASKFINNSANYGGAITDENLAISGCEFEGNLANTSGGALYLAGECLIVDSEFIENLASYGGAMYLEEQGNYTIESSLFIRNSANYGGALDAYSDTEETMAHIYVVDSEFMQNSANRSGGAVYSEGFILIDSGSFANNSANWGSTIYSSAYLYIIGSNITSVGNVTPVHFQYFYNDDDTFYGELYLKDNKITSENGAIYYNENEIPYRMPLYLVFTEGKVIKGKSVNVAHLEDGSGNQFYSFGIGDLKLTLTDKNGNVVRFTLPYNMTLEGYILPTSQISYATYDLDGKLSNNHPGNCIAKSATLTVTDSKGRTAPVITPSKTAKTYGAKLKVTVKTLSNKIMANVPVTVKLNGKTYALTTNKKGKVSLALKLVPKTYTAKVIFKGNKKYVPAAKTIKVTVKKIKTKIVASKKTFKVKEKTKKYTVTLKNNLGKVMKKSKLKLKINGKTYKAKTNSKGKATFSVKLTEKGKFKGTIKFAGNKYYKKTIKKVKITVK